MLRAASDYARDHGVHPYVMRMPSERFRRNPLLQDFLHNPDPMARERIDFMALSLMVMADRLQQLHNHVMPRLTKGRIILCDRYVHTGIAESYARDREDVGSLLCEIAEYFPEPDVMFLLDVSPRLAISRIRNRPKDRGRFFDEQVLRKTAVKYRELAKANHMKIVRTDGYDLDRLRIRTTALLDEILGNNNRLRNIFGKRE